MEKYREQERQKEENPFENEQVAQEWINSVEHEKDMGRDREVYPRLQSWLQEKPADLVVEIGSGQGICSDKLGNFQGKYIGIEPSTFLTERAKQLYGDDRREFTLGEAYDTTIESEAADASFSVMVWFHLEDLDKAAKELARILKKDGRFFIITANPDAQKIWESFYFDYTKEGNKITGKVNIPINPVSKSIFYEHSRDDILTALKNYGLEVEKVETSFPMDGEDIFLSITGKKK